MSKQDKSYVENGNKVTIRSDGSKRVQLLFDKADGRTEKSHLPYTQLGYVINRYIQSGQKIVVPHSEFRDLTQISDYADMLQKIDHAQDLFDQLPNNIRKHFQFDPANLIDALNDPSQHESLIELGILEKKESSPEGAQMDVETPSPDVSDEDGQS